MVIDNDYFHEGDVIYLDFYEFTSDNNGSVIYNWEQSNAQFYINFNKYFVNNINKCLFYVS